MNIHQFSLVVCGCIALCMALVPLYARHRYMSMRGIPNARRVWTRYTIAWEFQMSGGLVIPMLSIVPTRVPEWVLWTGLMYTLSGTFCVMLAAMALQEVVQRHKQLQRSHP